jgi:uncharacterized protein (TIGR03437 family)
MSVTIRYNLSRALVLTCAIALGPLAHSQPAPGGIVTRKIPFTILLSDSAGNLYFTGSVSPGQITPSPGAPQPQPGGGSCIASPRPFLPRPCNDAFLEKTDANGNVLFATYLGGPNDDFGSKLAIDSAGNIYVAGTTGGSFPTTAHAAVPATADAGGFIAKFSPDGSRLIYSTYLPNSSGVSALAVDAGGNAYLSGSTGGYAYHAFVVKLNPDGSAFLYNTLLAGSGQDFATALALDARGNVTVTGSTSSADFPVTAGVVQTKLAGTQNAFVARLDGDGKLVFSTYLGGSGMDSGGAVQLDSAGSIYVAGMATSLDYPTTPGTFQPAPAIPAWGASPGGFVAKLTPDAHALAYSTYLMIYPNSGGVRLLALNSAGEVYIAATVGGAGFPVTPNAPQPCFGGYRDILVAHLNAAGSLLEATYLGTSGVFAPDTLSLAADGTVLLSASFPQPPGIDQPTLAQIRFGAAGWNAPPCLSPNVVHAATLAVGDTISPGQLISLTGFGIGPETGVAYQPGPQGQAPLALAGVQVSFDGQAAPLIYAQSRQINAVAPVELDGRASTSIRVQYNGIAFGPVVVPVTFAAPELFRLHPGVSTRAAALNQDGTVNSSTNPAPRGSIVSLYATGFGLTTPGCLTGALNPPSAANLRATVSSWATPPGVPQVLYAGGAPTLLCGVEQINLRIPDQVPQPLNAVQVTLSVQLQNQFGANTTQGTTIAVK